MINVYKRRKSTNTTYLPMVDIQHTDVYNDSDHNNSNRSSTSNSTHKLQYVRGQRGNLLLLYKNFTYSKNNVKGNTTYWKCRLTYQGVKCNARITTVKRSSGLYDVFLTQAEHKHPPSKQRKLLVREETKRRKQARKQESTVAVYSATSRGRVQLIYGGQPFIYEKKIKLSDNQEKKYWRCNQWWNQKCRSRVCTINDMVMPLNRYHTHEEIVRRKKRVRKNVAGALTLNTSGNGGGGNGGGTTNTTIRTISVTEAGAATSNNIKLATTNHPTVRHIVTHAAGDDGSGVVVGGDGGNDNDNIDVSTLSMHLKYEEIVADVTEISDTTAIFIAKK